MYRSSCGDRFGIRLGDAETVLALGNELSKSCGNASDGVIFSKRWGGCCPYTAFCEVIAADRTFGIIDALPR